MYFRSLVGTENVCQLTLSNTLYRVAVSRRVGRIHCQQSTISSCNLQAILNMKNKEIFSDKFYLFANFFLNVLDLERICMQMENQIVGFKLFSCTPFADFHGALTSIQRPPSHTVSIETQISLLSNYIISDTSQI